MLQLPRPPRYAKFHAVSCINLLKKSALALQNGMRRRRPDSIPCIAWDFACAGAMLHDSVTLLQLDKRSIWKRNEGTKMGPRWDQADICCRYQADQARSYSSSVEVMIPLLSAFDIATAGVVLGFALASAFVWLIDFFFSFFRGYIDFRTGTRCIHVTQQHSRASEERRIASSDR